MSNLWKKEFKAQEIQTPKEILDEQCNELSKITSGKIIAKTEVYDGPTYSYTTDLTSTISRITEQTYNVQSDLGEIKNRDFKYEFFITSKITPSFKYRVMFFQYGITFYPVDITLDETIANEISTDEYITCNSSEEFTEYLCKILNSKKLENVITALLSI